MCGYLPFANHIEEIAKGGNSDGDDTFAQADNEDDDPFAHSVDEDDKNCDKDDIFVNGGSGKKDLPMEAVTFLREEIDMDDKVGMVFREVPVLWDMETKTRRSPSSTAKRLRTAWSSLVRM
jgi:hypothetical protein